MSFHLSMEQRDPRIGSDRGPASDGRGLVVEAERDPGEPERWTLATPEHLFRDHLMTGTLTWQPSASR